MVLKKAHLFLLFFLFSPISSLGAMPSWFLSKDKNTQKWAIIPAYFRNSTYGNMLSVRSFIYPSQKKGYYTGLGVNVSENFFLSSDFSYKDWRDNGDQLSFFVYYSNFYEPYYGEGNQTKISDRKNIKSHRLKSYMEYVTKLGTFLYGGAFSGFYYRKEEDSQVVHFPQESVLSGGLLLRYDSRDDHFHPTQGEYYQVDAWILSKPSSPFFAQGEVRLFFSLLKNLVFALRGKMSLSFFQSPSYGSQLTLGGANVLRGFLLNRFRGDNYYFSQVELRYTPIRWITLSSFFDLGAVFETKFVPPRYSFGGGFLLGFPPDYSKKIRVELGIGEDQKNFLVAFGYSF